MGGGLVDQPQSKFLLGYNRLNTSLLSKNVYDHAILLNGRVMGHITAVANTTLPETNPRLTADAQGLLAVWQRQNASGYDLYARPLDANGVPNGETFTIQETAVSQLEMINNQQNTAVAYGVNGRYQLAWQDDSTEPFTAGASYPKGRLSFRKRPSANKTQRLLMG
jgi:hypothetical protein